MTLALRPDTCLVVQMLHTIFRGHVFLERASIEISTSIAGTCRDWSHRTLVALVATSNAVALGSYVVTKVKPTRPFFGGRAVRRTFNVPRFTPVGLESRSHFSCLNDCIPIAQTYAERRQRRGD